MIEDIIKELLELENKIEQDLAAVDQDMKNERQQRLRRLEAEKKDILEGGVMGKKNILQEAEQKASEISQAIAAQTESERGRYESIYGDIHEEMVQKYFDQLLDR